MTTPVVTDALGRASRVRPSAPESRFYGRIVAELLARRPLFLLMLTGLVGHGLGHAALALAAGMLGRAILAPPGPGLTGPGLAGPGLTGPGLTGPGLTDAGAVLGAQPLWADSVARLDSLQAWLGATTDSSGWLVYTACYVGLAAAFVKAAAGTGVAWAEANLAGAVAERVRVQKCASLLKSGRPGHDSDSATLATIAVQLREVELAVGAGVVRWLRALCQLVPLGATLILLSPSLAGVALLTLIPFGWLLGRARRRLRGRNQDAQQLAEQLLISVDELIEHSDLWRTHGASRRILRVLEHTGRAATAARGRAEASRALLSGGNEVLAALAVLGAVLLSERLGLSLGDGLLVPFAAVFFMAYRPLRDLGDARELIDRGEVAWATLGMPEAPANEAPSRAEPPSAMPIATLELRAFGALERGPALNCWLRPGELLGVAGPVGSGKTTLLRALLGLAPSRGSLRYGDDELSGAAVGPHHRPFAWVPQEAPIVPGTVLENVALFGVDAERARAALRALGATGLLETADERVGPGARTLSGGERRLVCIARALCSGLPVLLVDEPTAGLDRASAARVISALVRLTRGGRQAIVATHDPEVLQVVSRIVRVEGVGG